MTMMNIITQPLSSGAAKHAQTQGHRPIFTAVSICLLLGTAASLLMPGLSGLIQLALWSLALAIGMLAVGSFQPWRDDAIEQHYPFMVVAGQFAGLLAMSLLFIDTIR